LSKHVTPRIYVVASRDNELYGLLACGYEPGSRTLSSFTNYYSQDFRPTLLGQSTAPATALPELVEAVIDAIAADRPRWRQVEFEYLRSDRPDATLLRAALRSRGFISILSRQYENWFLTTGGQNFESYFAQRSSQLRNTITRKEKKIKKSHALDIKIYTQNDAALAQAVGAYTAIYNSSWKNPEPHPDFIPTFARMCADLGILRLGVAYLDGQAAAAQFWIVSGAKALIYKLAYAEQFAELSVGSILSRELFKHAIDVDRVTEIDYGVGSEPYKREWMNSVRQFERLTAYNLLTVGGAVSIGKKVASAGLRRISSRRGA
jgi:hypothetical protein